MNSAKRTTLAETQPAVEGDGKSPGTTTRENIPIECYHNGSRILRALPEAHALFWEVEFGWLLPLDWYRYDVKGHSRDLCVYEVVPRSSRLMAFFLHTRGRRALTLGDLRMLDAKSRHIGRNVFFCRMARLNSTLYRELPEELRPFDFIDTPRRGLVPEPGYRLNPHRSALLIQGVDPGSEFGDDDVDWALFQEPPVGLSKEGKRPKS